MPAIAKAYVSMCLYMYNYKVRLEVQHLLIHLYQTLKLIVHSKIATTQNSAITDHHQTTHHH